MSRTKAALGLAAGSAEPGRPLGRDVLQLPASSALVVELTIYRALSLPTVQPDVTEQAPCHTAMVCLRV